MNTVDATQSPGSSQVAEAMQTAGSAASLLELQDIHSYYGHIHALHGISLTVNEGEIVTLIGANGVGKSTTLRTISGLIKPRHGTIRLKGQDIAGMPPHQIVTLGVGHVPEGRGSHLRKKIEEDPKDPHYIITVHRMGYIFEKQELGYKL